MQWLPDVVVHDGIEFVTLPRSDRKLAAFLGFALADSCPLKDCGLLDALADARNVVVDAEMAKIGVDDPMQEAPCATTKRPRAELADDIPFVLSVPVSIGDCEIVVRMLSTPTRLAKVTIEFTDENMAMLIKGADHAWPTRYKPRARADVETGQPNVTWGKQRGCVQCKYLEADGKLRTKSMKPKDSDVPALREENLRSAAATLQEFYNTRGDDTPPAFDV